MHGPRDTNFIGTIAEGGVAVMLNSERRLLVLGKAADGRTCYMLCDHVGDMLVKIAVFTVKSWEYGVTTRVYKMVRLENPDEALGFRKAQFKISLFW